MFERTARQAITLSLIFSIGLHWIVLQSVAWTGMLIQYSKTNTFTEAVEMTFSGMKPCRLCKFVKEGQEAEKKHKTIVAEYKLDLFVGNSPSSFVPSAFWSFAVFPRLQQSAVIRNESPLTPPPLFV